jgi:hypothetical protein
MPTGAVLVLCLHDHVDQTLAICCHDAKPVIVFPNELCKTAKETHLEKEVHNLQIDTHVVRHFGLVPSHTGT